MSLLIPQDWEKYRRPHWADGDMGDHRNGCFQIPTRAMVIVCSNGEGWEHVSVSVRGRCPTWEEMEWVKRELWDRRDTVMQLHVPPAEHKNCHPYCLHLWRPLNAEIPRPASIMVAP